MLASFVKGEGIELGESGGGQAQVLCDDSITGRKRSDKKKIYHVFVHRFIG